MELKPGLSAVVTGGASGIGTHHMFSFVFSLVDADYVFVDFFIGCAKFEI